MSIAVYRDLILDRLRDRVPEVLQRYRAAHDLEIPDAPDPAVYLPGPPPLTSAEGYPAVYVTPLELLSLVRSEVPGEFTARYRYEAVGFVRGETAPKAAVSRDALGTVLRAALISAPRLSDRVLLEPTTVLERYSAVEPVAGGTLAGIGMEFQLTAHETTYPATPTGTADRINVLVSQAPHHHLEPTE
jgi:hypothetical protein